MSMAHLDFLERLAGWKYRSRPTFQRLHRALIGDGVLVPRERGRAARAWTPRDGLVLLLADELGRRDVDVPAVVRAAWELPLERLAPDDRPAVINMPGGDSDSGRAARTAVSLGEELAAALGVATREPLGPALESLGSPGALDALEAQFEELALSGGRPDLTVRLFSESLSAVIDIEARVDRGSLVSARRTLHYGPDECPEAAKLLALRDDSNATEQERAAARRALARRVWHDRPREIARLRLDDILIVAGLLREDAHEQR
jgi:hypothetical protein